MKYFLLTCSVTLALLSLGCIEEEKKKDTASTDGGGSSGGGGGGSSPSVSLDSASKKFHFTVTNLTTRAATAPVFASFPAAGNPTIDNSSPNTNLTEPAEPTQTVIYNTTKLGTVSESIQPSIDQNANSRSHSLLLTADATTCTSSMDLACAINGTNAKQLDLTSIVTTGFTASTANLSLTVNGSPLSSPTFINSHLKAQNHDTTYSQRLAREAVALGDYIYFNGWNSISGSETTALFRVHKTTLDTEVVLNTNPGFGTTADTSHLTAFNGALYFRARTSSLAKYQLIKFDPVSSTLTQVSSTTTLLNPRSFHVFENNMYFFAENSSGYTKLYKMNSSGGIKQLSDLCPTANEAGLKMISSSTALYVSLISPLRCNDSVKRWIISRVNADDSLTALHYYDSGSTFLVDDGLREVILYNSKNYLNIGLSGLLYRDDGTQLYRAIHYDTFGRPTTPVAGLSIVNGYLYYKVANSVSEGGNKIFRYDGVSGEIREVNTENILPDVKMIRSFNNKLYVTMKNPGNWYKLYRLDANDNFVRVSDFNPGSGDDIISDFIYNNELYFFAKAAGGVYRVHKVSADETLHQVTSSGLSNSVTLLGTPLGLVMSSTAEDAIQLIQ